MATSFRKRVHSSKSHLRGTRPSLQNAALLLVSTGVPSMDALLGGGLGVGSIMLVEEDVYESYSRVLFKYYLSEGVMCGHSLLLSSASEKPLDLLNDLPGPVQEDSNEMPSLIENPLVEDDERSQEMMIAWRYQSLPKFKSSFSNKFGHRFDLTCKMEPERISSVKTAVADFFNSETRRPNEMYSNLLQAIEAEIRDGNFCTSDPKSLKDEQKSVIRIGIQSLGSPLWHEDASSDSITLTRFFHSLRCVLHGTNAVVMVTMPTHLFENSSYVRRIERLCDCVVKLESFAGSDKEHNPLYREYHGLFHLVKLPRIKSLTCHYPETLDLAFKLKRKKFVVEKLHIPPELSDTAARPQEDDSQVANGKSKVIKSKRIDF